VLVFEEKMNGRPAWYSLLIKKSIGVFANTLERSIGPTKIAAQDGVYSPVHNVITM